MYIRSTDRSAVFHCGNFAVTVVTKSHDAIEFGMPGSSDDRSQRVCAWRRKNFRQMHSSQLWLSAKFLCWYRRGLGEGDTMLACD